MGFRKKTKTDYRIENKSSYATPIKKQSSNVSSVDKPSYVGSSIKSSTPIGFAKGFCEGYKSYTGKVLTLYDGEKFSISYLEQDLDKVGIDTEDFGFVIGSEWGTVRAYVGDHMSLDPTLKSVKNNLREVVDFYGLYLSKNRKVNPILKELGYSTIKPTVETYKHVPKEDIASDDYILEMLCKAL